MPEQPEEKPLTIVPCFLIRSTGFPFEYLDTQRLPMSAVYVQRLLALQQCREKWCSEFEYELFPVILACEQQGGASSSIFKLWYRLRRFMQKSLPCPPELIAEARPRMPEIAAWLEGWNAITTAQDDLQQAYDSCVEIELRQAREQLYTIIMSQRFQEALLLSNPNMYTTALASYVRHYTPDQRPAKVRHLENRFYAYLQRFCAKNDTTSFFGPIDYGYVDTSVDSSLTLIRKHERSPTQRKTRMSYWAADVLAQCIAKEEAIQPYLQPQLQVGITLLTSGELYVATGDRRISLSRDMQRLIAFIDGQRTMQDILNIDSAAFCPLLQQLRKQGIVTLQVKIPAAAIDPLAWLRAYVASLPERCTARSFWLRSLDAFIETITRFPLVSVADKFGLLQEMERRFALLTGQEPRRGEGEMYTDRLLVYDEAQGDITSCIVGKPLHDRLLDQLRLPLDLCASYSLLIQQVCRRRAQEIFLSLGHGSALPYLLFVRELEARIGIDECLADPAVLDFLKRLNRLVSERIGDDGCARLGVADIHPFLRAIPEGTLTSPDIFFSRVDPAKDVAANCMIVLGEMHYGVQVWCHFLTFYEKQAELYSFLASLLNARTGQARMKAGLVHKRHQGKTFYFELPGYSIEILGRSLKERAEVLSVADLEVALVSGELVVRSRSRGEVIELYPGDPRSISNWLFGTPPVICPVPSLGIYTPRIMIRDVVTWRASWQLRTRDLLPHTSSPGPGDLLLHASRLRRSYNLPERCFVRIASERKPFYVDFTSLLSIEFFFTMIRNSSTVNITEMLPTPNAWWLRDSGVRGCEWRMTLVYSGHGGGFSYSSSFTSAECTAFASDKVNLHYRMDTTTAGKANEQAK
jgi:hypothetical protein